MSLLRRTGLSAEASPSMAEPADRVIVQLKPISGTGSAPTVSELCDEIAAVTSSTLVRPPSATGRAVFQLAASSDLDRLLEQIRALDYVEYVEPDAIDRAQQE